VEENADGILNDAQFIEAEKEAGVIADVNAVCQDIAANGVSIDHVMALEAIKPGVILDNYPAGGFSAKPSTKNLRYVAESIVPWTSGLMLGTTKALFTVMSAQHMDKKPDAVASQMAKAADDIEKAVKKYAETADQCIKDTEKVPPATPVPERMKDNIKSVLSRLGYLDPVIDTMIRDGAATRAALFTSDTALKGLCSWFLRNVPLEFLIGPEVNEVLARGLWFANTYLDVFEELTGMVHESVNVVARVARDMDNNFEAVKSGSYQPAIPALPVFPKRMAGELMGQTRSNGSLQDTDPAEMTISMALEKTRAIYAQIEKNFRTENESLLTDNNTWQTVIDAIARVSKEDALCDFVDRAYAALLEHAKKDHEDLQEKLIYIETVNMRFVQEVSPQAILDTLRNHLKTLDEVFVNLAKGVIAIRTGLVHLAGEAQVVPGVIDESIEAMRNSWYKDNPGD